MNWRKAVKYMIPQSFRESVLLALPVFYKTKIIDYETVLRVGGGIEDLLKQLGEVLGVDGDIAECGSAWCGTSIIMAGFLRQRRSRKLIYAYDSFQGFDFRELAGEREKGLTAAGSAVFKNVNYEYVKKKIRKLKFECVIKPVKGYFKDTLSLSDSRLAFVLIDCDLEESALYCAESIWPKLNSGGRIVFDDYNSSVYRGVKKAVEEFLLKHNSEITAHGLMKRLYYVAKK